MDENGGLLKYRIVLFLGIVISISYVVIPAPDCLLGYGITNALDYLSEDVLLMITFFCLPCILFIVAVVMAFRTPVVKATSVLAIIGMVIFIALDVMLGIKNQAYIGLYINAVGAVIAAAGAILIVLNGTDETEIEEMAAVDRNYYKEELKQREKIIYSEDNFDSDLSAQSTTDFYKGMEKMFAEGNTEREDLIHENEEINWSNNIIDNGNDNTDNSSDSFWR